MVAFVSLSPGEASWTILLPLKDLARAKSRLRRPDRSRLALAMALDTVCAVLASAADLVGAVVVVTNDRTVRQALTRLRDVGDAGALPDGPTPPAAAIPTSADPASPTPASPTPASPVLPAWMRERLRVIPDVPDHGLNPALVHGAVLADRWRPGRPLAAMSADLPALRTAELRRALLEAAHHARAVLADATGTGTVLLTAAAGQPLEPAFGVDSHAAHRRSGAVDLTAALGATVPGLRRDVDTVEDLAEAAFLGVGDATAAALDPRRILTS
ncbi:2-phospho-L-lactate guanylyltransferase [Frankia sp. AgB32]|uniref:2-phospho-L-lactate guanylyltransferase n=1 Tax=Frankia sp. AgB32 TaxID=631119 RepID=UPI0020105853|nr:2-phospho-L-lactate guanylyltransferase [Frankia sp. AgB32]MCK9894666.1 2-phospho-L-lactate guanylyltransferase [Frankia sp. AgB32]